MLMDFYESIGTNVFKWEGMPKEIRPFYPEQTLYRQGMCAMIQLPGTDLYDIFPVAYGSISLDLHGEPIAWRVYVLGDTAISNQIRNTQYDKDNSVLIWNNPMRTPMSKYVESQVLKMLKVDSALDTNVMVQNTPVYVKADKENTLLAKNLFATFELEPAVFATKRTMDDASIDVINLNVDFIGDKLSDQYETYHNRILRYLGIGHLPVEKQERMLTGEVDSNDELMSIITRNRLECREHACQHIKDVFGLDIEVQLYADIKEQENMDKQIANMAMQSYVTGGNDE